MAKKFDLDLILEDKSKAQIVEELQRYMVYYAPGHYFWRAWFWFSFGAICMAAADLADLWICVGACGNM